MPNQDSIPREALGGKNTYTANMRPTSTFCEPLTHIFTLCASTIFRSSSSKLHQHSNSISSVLIHKCYGTTLYLLVRMFWWLLHVDDHLLQCRTDG